MDSTLAPVDDTICSSLIRLPGLSSIFVSISRMRPLLERPRVMIRDSIVTSTLPPDTTHTVFFIGST